MMGAANMASLALPALGPTVPPVVHIAGQSGMPAALAIALLEAKVITDAMLAPPNNPLVQVFNPPHEEQLSASGLSAWWSELRRTYPTKFFAWDMHVQELTNPPNGHRDDKHILGWFCLTRSGGDIPRFTLESKTMQLETILPGFGQTVLAVLYDALDLLPEPLSPPRAEQWAQWIYWSDYADDEEFIEYVREEHGLKATDPIPEDVMTREQFFKNMPRWSTSAQRVVSRVQICDVATDQFSQEVIAACDALIAVVSAPGFALDRFDVGCHTAGFDPMDGSVVLLWREFDVVGQVIDEALNYFMDGESCEMIDMCAVPLTKKNVLKYQKRMAEMLQVAQAAERLIELIGVRLYE